MSRTGWVEVYRTTRSHTRWDGPELVSLRAPGWSWRFLSNGRIISRCSEAHGRLRDVARSLELSFPGYRLLDQDCGLDGPTWFLYGLQFAYPNCAAEVAIPDDQVMGVGMRGVRIPVLVPVGVWLGSRYRR